MLEKRFRAISPQSFTADGTQNGVVTVFNSTIFKVKQEVRVNGTALPQLELEVKDIPNATQLVVGPRGGSITKTIDISSYTVATSGTIDAEEQKRPPIDYAEIMRAVYAEEPAVALRNLLVDKLGNSIDTTTDGSGTNRLAVDAEVTVNTVQLFTKPYDTIKALYPTAVQEVYKTYLGGIGGTLQETVTVNYVDSTKNQIDTVVRT